MGSQKALSQAATSVNTPVQMIYYAKVPGAQGVGPGAYMDTVIVQVTF